MVTVISNPNNYNLKDFLEQNGYPSNYSVVNIGGAPGVIFDNDDIASGGRAIFIQNKSLIIRLNLLNYSYPHDTYQKNIYQTFKFTK